MKNLELIDKYFSNSLSPKEQKLFNELLQNDQNFKKANVNLTTLSDYDHLLDQTFDSNYISENELETLKKWRENPSEWNQ